METNAKPRKVMVLGIDAPIVPRLRAWAEEGQLPTLQRLMVEGVFASNCLGPFPTITPPNWTTIATGAWPGTHGITDFDGHVLGEPLDSAWQNFDATHVRAETLWQAAAREGKRTVVVNYPCSWQTELKDGWRVAGYGLNPNEWRAGLAFPARQNNLTSEILISAEPYPFSSDVTWRRAVGWDGLELGPNALESEVQLDVREPLHEMTPVRWYVLADQSKGEGYDSILVARSKEEAGVFARLQVGQWSPHIYDSFETSAGRKRAVFRMKLLELAPDASTLRIYVPGLCALDGWAGDPEIERAFTSERGLPMTQVGWSAFRLGWIDLPTLVEATEFQHNWLADVSLHLLMNKPWDLFFVHIHTPDWLYHCFSVELEPLASPGPETRAEYEKAELALYQGVDRCLSNILQAADEGTLVIVTSDHGAKAKTNNFSIRDILEQSGLMVRSPSGEIDWSRTKAFPHSWVHVYVNTKGRDPQGIVAPGEEYQNVVRRVIDALYTYVDPDTGMRPIALALSRNDARILGHHDERSGDVIYAVDPWFDKEHGRQLPTSQVGIGDLRSLLIMAGPGVKKGVVIDRTVWLTDIVPTICYLADYPVPENCEGAVIYQALADRDARLNELQALRRNVERLKRMVERPPMC